MAVVIAARTGALTGLAQVCRWPYAVGAAAVAVGAAVAGKRSGPPLRLTALAVIATGLSILTAHDPHWLYASAGRVEAWMVDREEVIAGLPDQRGEPCLLPIASAEPLGADRAPLVLVQRFATEQRDILLCATERLELAMVNVPQTEEEPVVALPATLGPNGTIVGGLQADGLQQHLDLAHWWTADQAGTAVLTEAVTDVIVA